MVCLSWTTSAALKELTRWASNVRFCRREMESLPGPHHRACLSPKESHSNIHACMLGSVVQSAGAANIRTSAKQQKAKYSLLGDSDHGHNSICGWTRALQWGQIMIDARSHLLYSSLCIHNSPDRDGQSQISKYTIISLTLTIKLFCLTNLDETANSFGFFWFMICCVCRGKEQ